MQQYTVYIYLQTALHVSGGISTHHQERISLYLQYLALLRLLHPKPTRRSGSFRRVVASPNKSLVL